MMIDDGVSANNDNNDNDNDNDNHNHNHNHIVSENMKHILLSFLGAIILCTSWARAFVPHVGPSLAFRHSRPPAIMLSAIVTSSQKSPTSAPVCIWTEERLIEYAEKQGILLSLSTLGPGYRAVARAQHNASQILGYCEGFLRPPGQPLHVDKMEVFRKMVLKAKVENGEIFTGGGTIFGPGLLLGFICLLHGKKNGYQQAEFLAIDDEEKQHKRLVNYYARSGFKIIKYVGDDFGDIPARMVWGGCGTLMRESIDTLLQSWTATLEKSERKSKR
jgi:hypothetical protein